MENKTMNNKKLLAIIIGIVIIAAITITCIYFVVSDNGEQRAAFKIETPFVELEYPLDWKGNLNIEWRGTNNTGNLAFFAKIEDGEEQEIFAIHFNEDAQIPVGILRIEDGSNVYIGYSLANPQFGENWSDDKKAMFYAMQNDVNFVIQQLSTDSRFTAE